jgi:hypothetical protein
VGEWHRDAHGVLDAAADRWEARITGATDSAELTVYHADTKPLQVPGAPSGLLFRPIALFSRYGTEDAAKSAAERFISAHAGEPEPELAAPRVAWVTIGGRPPERAFERATGEPRRQYVAPMAPAGPFRWSCDCGEAEENLPSPYAAYGLAYVHGREFHPNGSDCDHRGCGRG